MFLSACWLSIVNSSAFIIPGSVAGHCGGAVLKSITKRRLSLFSLMNSLVCPILRLTISGFQAF
jgi:hypothetical protein